MTSSIPIFGKVSPQIHHPVADVTVFVVVPLSRDQLCLVDDSLIEIRKAKDVG